MTSSTIPGALSVDALRRLNFYSLSPADQVRALRRMRADGLGEYSIAGARA